MLLSIEGANSNPTQVLIAAIQQRGGTGITKEEDFYLGFLENGNVHKVVKILSGDPSRGAMSLDMEDSLLVGQTIQPASNTFTFSSLAPSDEAGDVIYRSPRVVDGFLALSEGGFIYSNPTSSICTAPGAVSATSW